MSHTFKSTEHVYIRSMGRLLRVTAIATGADEANAYMEAHKDQGLLAECGEFCFMADVRDKGTKIPRLLEHDREELPSAEAKLKALVDHIAAMADDAYLTGHPEWIEIVKEAQAAKAEGR